MAKGQMKSNKEIKKPKKEKPKAAPGGASSQDGLNINKGAKSGKK